MKLAYGLMGSLTLLTGGCDDRSARDIHADVHVISTREDGLATAAMERLAERGGAALVHIETGMHTAPDSARLRLVSLMRRIGDANAIPILRHFAVFDVNAEVRSACDDTLEHWSKASGPHAVLAREAIALAKQKRAEGHGPIVRGP
jgi:hypothetical protein